jgi:Cation transporting ATPase, C-terminus/Amino acid permease
MSRSSADPATVRPPEQPISADGDSTRDEGEPRTLGLTSATGLVIGSIVGTGVFTLPAVLAAAGTVSLIVLGVVAVGALLLAVLFGQLTRRVPKSYGGLYAYARHEFGDFAGYLTGWCYWPGPSASTPPATPSPCRCWATQILWINLLTDSAPALALGVDPPPDDVMARPPRRLTDRIIDARMWAGIVWVGLVMATVTLVALDLRLEGGIFGGSGGIEEARTMAFTTLVLAQLLQHRWLAGWSRWSPPPAGEGLGSVTFEVRRQTCPSRRRRAMHWPLGVALRAP